MTDPTTFAPLEVRDFEVEWDSYTNNPEVVPEGSHFERALVRLPNGYTLSLVRTNMPPRDSHGYDSGLWEAAIVRDNPDPMERAFGQTFVPAPELKDLATVEDEEFPDDTLVGNLDNAGIQALAETVAEREPVSEVEEGDEPTDEQLLAALFQGLFGTPGGDAA